MALISPDEFTDYHLTIDDFIKVDVEKRLEHQTHVMFQICKFFQKGSCVKGKLCTFKHIKLERNVMCKHWFRGLCKKNEWCEFLHELDLSKMPICDFFLEQGECTKDGCLFLHVDPNQRIKNCPFYTQGFCRHGPNCRNRHIRKEACSNYLAGFCPLGPNCPHGHPKFELPVEDKSGYQFQTTKTCNKCSQPGHIAFNCPNFRDSVPKAARNMNDVMCFKCGQRGHYANMCINPKTNAGFSARSVPETTTETYGAGYSRAPQYNHAPFGRDKAGRAPY